MSRITTAALTALSYIAAIALATPVLANAAEPPPPPAPAAKPVPNTHTVIINGKPQTFYNLPGAPVGGDASAAYQYRTRILGSPPSCQDFANQADAAFLSSTFDDKTKTDELNRIGAAAAAAGCLAP